MRTQLMLFAGVLAGLSLAATPALSQQTPRTQPPGTRPPTTTPPSTTPPSTTPGMSRSNQSDTFHQAAAMLEGSWTVTVKTFSPNAASGSASSSQQPTSTVQGNSTRRWVLDRNILVEEVTTSQTPTLSSATENYQVREQNPSTTRPDQERPSMPSQTPRTGSSESFQGHGMFGYNQQGNEFQHVWADSTGSKLTYSTGRFDPSTKTFTFNVQHANGMSSPMRSSPSSSPSRPGTSGSSGGGSQDALSDQATPGTQPQTPPSTPPSTTPPSSRPGMTPSRGTNNDIDFNDVARITIRITDESHQTVEYYVNSSSGQPVKIMEIDYTKSRS